ncbi:unnamed protein product [Moneuplotes crassus]|uniref:Uncharacterized protein n=1 Tax=Euplotes crassus TaxID=5936 RepID=A0AAD1Y3T3_EUPCR|nr:unnamed protein product [Moneuplotes crassus]
MESVFSHPHSSKYHVDSIMNQKISNQKKSNNEIKIKKHKSLGNKKRSGANSSLSLIKEDYNKCLNNLRHMNKACKNITIETSKNNPIPQKGLPITCTRGNKIGVFNRRSGKYKKDKKMSSSPLITRRVRKEAESTGRKSSRPSKNGTTSSKRALKNQKGKLQIVIHEMGHDSQSPTSRQARNGREYPSSSRVYDNLKSKKNLKSCKSMRSIEPQSYSCRNKNEEYKTYKNKNHRSARDNKATYSNYLSSEPLSNLPVFNTLVESHGPKRSIDSSSGLSCKNDRNSLSSNRGGSVRCSQKASSKNSKIYVYDSNQYTSNMYTNEYSNSAQTSQFTFGPGPDSKTSDIAYSGQTSANKSINKDNILSKISETSLKKKIKHKSKRSTASDKHHRSSSRGSKNKRGPKRRSSRSKHPGLNGYFGKNSMKRPTSKSRNELYKSSSSNNYQLQSKASLKLGDFLHSGMTPNNRSFLKNQDLPSMSPFLSRMTQKSKNSRNEALFKVQTNQKSCEKFLNLLPSCKGPTKKSRNTILTQIKSTAHAKTNSYFNIPGCAYGTDDKSGNSSSERSSRSRARKKHKIEKARSSLLNKKLLKNNKRKSSFVPANNCSGASTQGSSIKDFKGTIKKKFQQNCYYKSTQNPSTNPKKKVEDTRSHHIKYEAISPKIILVDENNPEEDYRLDLHNKLRHKNKNLHEYLVSRDNPLNSPLNLPGSSNLVSHVLGVHNTIETEDRNQNSSHLDLLNINSQEVSMIEHNTSHLKDEPQKETQKDLQGLITILEKFE